VIEIRRHRARADRGRLRVGGVDHARQRLIDAEQGLARHDLLVVDAGDALAEQSILGSRFQRHRRGIGHGQSRGELRELAVRGAAIRGLVSHRAVSGSQLARRHVPALRCRLHEHRTRDGAGLTEPVPIGRHGRRAARDLRTVELEADRRLLDTHVVPLRVELFRDDHRQRRLDALPDLGVLREQHDRAVGPHLNERIGRERDVARLRRGAPGAGAHGPREHEPASGNARELDEVAPVELERRRGPRPGLQVLNDLGNVRVSPDRRLVRAHELPPALAIFAAAVWIALRMRA
jgi:hypothetical protein